MRKKELSDEKIENIIELRQSGDSWLRIEKKTGVERRVAKRAYNDWLRDRTLSELKQARVNVATEAFSDHVDYLVKLAERLIDHLNAPESCTEKRCAKDVLHSFLETNILGESYELSQVDRGRKSRRNYRQNLMLLESLKDHTREKVRWQALDEWEKAWDSCLGLFDNLKVKAQKEVTDTLNQENDLLQRIKGTSQLEQAEKRMIKAVLDAIWQSILDGKFNPEYPEVVITDKLIDRVVSIFTEKEWLEKLVDVCQNVAQNLLHNQIELFRQLYDEACTIKKTIEELEEMLDRLILRPIILLTPRCKLCPA